MKKADKESALELASILQKANTEVAKLVEQKNIAALQAILTECQNGAISLGTMIEESEGEGFCTVRILEEYCEQLFLLHEMIMSADEVGANMQIDELQKTMDRAESSIRNDIAVRKEAVFLPYKASMWDSLESVWKEKNADPAWNAYVIPIPYFDKNPDGTAKEAHYEGDQYPEYVPITHYNNYDFQKRHPDEIYIHNPYDDGNYVTSVHPFFYSSNLKQFTDKLIYIPYFVLAEPDPTDPDVIEGISHYVTVPAVLHADKVIVQSENMRLAYIEAMTAYAGKQSRSIWEKKIFGTGSPKFDKLADTKKEDLVIPEHWLKIIQREDGSYKKIILYNNSVSALLQNGEKMLEKIQSVLDIFRENQDAVALLWRPHPLIKATIESMRPQLWQDYKAIVDRYLDEDWGIYDDSAQMDRAIILCDAYYGDPSSMVQLCQKVKMPIMIQNCEIL